MRGPTVRDRAAFLPRTGTLVVADLHVGRDEASSVRFPLGERCDLTERLDALVTHFGPERVVLAGDVLHRFDRVGAAARDGLDAIAAVCRQAGARPVAVAGNHDAMLAGAWDGEVREAYALGEGTVVCHGHEAPPIEGSRYVIGHLHPTITIEGNRHPCFLRRPDEDGNDEVLVLPAFNRLASGLDVNWLESADVTSPLLEDIDAFRPIVYDPDSQETLEFPPLAELRRLL
ncbi:MAG: metallophosphoesterase [Haloferacaceae archaeon]